MKFNIGDDILLSTRNLILMMIIGGRCKLGALYIEPFKIVKKFTRS